MGTKYFFEKLDKNLYGIFKNGQDLGIGCAYTNEDAEIIVGALNAAAPINGENLPKATIEDNEGDFCVYDESGHLIYDGFDSYEKAKAYASEDGYEVVELIHTATIGKGVEGLQYYFNASNDNKTLYIREVGSSRVLVETINDNDGNRDCALIVSKLNEQPTLYKENLQLTAEVTRLRSLINEFADGIKNA